MGHDEAMHYYHVLHYCHLFVRQSAMCLTNQSAVVIFEMYSFAARRFV